jgi:hypothetical protein
VRGAHLETFSSQKIGFNANCICRGAYALVARRNPLGTTGLDWKIIDSNVFSRLDKRRGIALKSVFCDQHLAIVAIQKIK